MDTMNDRYNLHKDKFEKFSSAEIMEALNEFFSNPKWRDEKRFVITSKFGVTRDYGIGFKRVDLAADWAIDSAIRYLREEFGIFYAPDTVDKDDEYRKQDIKCTNDCYTSNLTKEIVRLEKEVHDECVRADYWFKTARARLDEIEKLKEDRRQHAKDDTDYILTAFRDILDALGIDKSNYVHMDIPSLKRYTISEVSKAASNLDNYREGAVKFAKDYSALQDEKESLEKDVRHLTDWNADLEKALETKREDHSRLADSYVKLCKEKEKTVRASKENLMDILEALGVSKSFSIGQNMEFLQRHAIQRASLIKSEHDKLIKTIDASKAINDARYERLNDLVIKISTMYSKIFNPEPGETCACTAERQLEAIESYIYELRSTNEYLQKDVSKWIAKCNNLRIRCNSVFGAGGFVTKAKINDLCDEYDIVKPLDNEDCEASLRYILDILKEYRDKAVNDLAGVLAASTKAVNDANDKYNQLLFKYDSAEKLRKEWCRKYESEHERAHGEHKRADKYWAQVAGLQTRIKNLEDALNRSASNATGYEALKNTLRKTLDSEARLKFERDALADELHKAKDAIRKQNEAILRKERLDEPSDNCDSEE